MADPTTELASEFLEVNNYLVRKETKFYKNKERKGTASDIDIIATAPQGVKLGNLELKKNVIAEAKNWGVMKTKTLDRIYKRKFRFIDKDKISWPQLRKYISTKSFDKVLFCLATTDDVGTYAKRKYEIKIVTTGFMIKQIAKFFKNSPRNWSYYPEWYNYNIIKGIMYYLFSADRFRDRLLLSDIVWIDAEKEPKYRNRFVEANAKFFQDFIYHQTTGEVFASLIKRFAQSPWRGWFKRQLKADREFWKYLTK